MVRIVWSGSQETASMRNAICSIAAVAVVSSASLLCSQIQTSSYSLAVRVSPTAAKAGSNFILEVDLTNNTKQRIATTLCLGTRVECNFEISVRDGAGTSAPETRYLKAVRNEPTGHAHLISAPSYAVRSIEPGETIKFASDLPGLYIFNRPGTYTVQVSREENGVVVQSDPATFTVTPNPQFIPLPEPCTSTAEVVVTVKDPSGAMVPGALVVLRPETASADLSEVRILKTSAGGTVRTSLPCGPADLFVGGFGGLAPYAQTVWLEENINTVSVLLK